MPARGNAPGTFPSTSSALQGRRIPAPLQGAPIDSETQGVALGYHAPAPSAPEPNSSEKFAQGPLSGYLFLLRKGHELIAEAADSHQMAGLSGLFLDIPAQTNHEIVYGARVRILVEAPNVLEDCFSGNRMPRILD